MFLLDGFFVVAIVSSADFWNIADGRGRLTTGELSATVELARPDRGLHEIAIRSAAGISRLAPPVSQVAPQLLAVQNPGDPRAQDRVVGDFFVRGRDLVVTYASPPEQPVRVQVYWRAVDNAEAPGAFAAFDVQVSVQTNLLDAVPAMTLQSTLPASDVRHLERSIAEFCAHPRLPAEDGLPADNSQPAVAGARVALLPDDPPRAGRGGYWLCRFPAAGLCYLEIVHPDDVARDRAEKSLESTVLAHQLFPDPLEKGVILRARARGVFFPIDAAEASFDVAVRRFLLAPLPLTT